MWFYTSDIVLCIDLDTAYLVLPNTRSRIARYYYLFNHPKKAISPILNRVILIEYKALCHIVSLSAEVETADVFYNTQIAIPIQYLLESLEYPQLATPIKTNNSIAVGFVYNNIYWKRSKF